MTRLTFTGVVSLTELTETVRVPSFGFCWHEEQLWAEVIWPEPRGGDGRRPTLPRRSLSGLGAISRSNCSRLLDLKR